MGTPLAFFKRTRLITPLSSFAAKGTPSCTRALWPAHRGVLACRSSVLLVLSGGRLPEWTSRSPKVRKPKKTQQSKLKTQKLLPKTAVQEKSHSIKLNIIDQNWGYPLKKPSRASNRSIKPCYCAEDFHQKSSPLNHFCLKVFKKFQFGPFQNS